ncbi:hypothetical protein ACFL21_02175 [Patescibacteria group bacterium]
MPASRSTVSFTESNWEKLAKSDNKSKTVNIALKFYFDSKELLKQKQEEFILNELQHYEDTDKAYSFEETFK